MISRKSLVVWGNRALIISLHFLAEKWNPVPDLLVILNNKLDNLESGKLQGLADLVVEILSESTRKTGVEDKIPHFLNEGVQEAWIIDPKNKAITLRWNDGEMIYPDPDSAEVIASRILPGLRIPVAWIWNRASHPTKEDLQELIG